MKCKLESLIKSYFNDQKEFSIATVTSGGLVLLTEILMEKNLQWCLHWGQSLWSEDTKEHFSQVYSPSIQLSVDQEHFGVVSFNL